MNDCADADACQNIRKDLFERVQRLLLCVRQTFSPCRNRLIYIGAVRCADKRFYMFLHTQLSDNSAAGDGNDKTEGHIDNGYLGAENTHEQHQAS